MADRELLERAAMAAGLDYHIDHLDGCPKLVSNGRIWNPLVDNDAAFKLAVALNMGISIPVMRTPMADVISFRSAIVNVRESGRDIEAVTRRAIVRAAAATVEGGA